MSGALPQLPQEISPDGREVWDWAAKLSAETHRRDAISTRRAELIKTGTRCGDCNNWMKSRQCPKEANVGGMSRGPSAETPKCGSFVETAQATQRRARLAAEIAELEAAA